MPFRFTRTAAAAGFALAAAACSATGSDGAPAMPTSTAESVAATDGPGGLQEVTIRTTNSFRFDPAVVTAHVGKLRVTLIDAGSYPHNLSVGTMHFTSHIVTGNLGQNTTSFTMRFSKPGTYPFVCTFHSSAGMRGEFVVR